MITINNERFLRDLSELRAIGAVGSGVVRQALSPTDLQARRWLACRMKEAGLEPVWDPVGNLFGLGPSHEGGVLIGSHADTQPQGGWLDGAFGVVCGLEIARAAREAGIEGVSCVAFSDEEGLFHPLLGSRYWAGEVSLEDLDAACDGAGRPFGEVRLTVPEMQKASAVSCHAFGAFLEPHIEQGPVLDVAGEVMGVVNSIVGIRHVELVFSGQQNHAGTTPMALRSDAVQAFLAYASAVNAELDRWSAEAVWTFGQVDVEPNAVSIVPGRVRTVLQLRAGNARVLAHMTDIAMKIAEQCDKRPCTVNAALTASLEPSELDPALVDILRTSASACGNPDVRVMLSGALHDAAPVSRVIPTGMLFAPSRNGVSHSFDEDTDPAHLAQVCAVTAVAAGQILSRGAAENLSV